MKTFTIHTLTAILLVGLTAAASAQIRGIVTKEQADIINAAIRQTSNDASKQSIMNTLMDGNDSIWHVSGFLSQDYFREGIGVSEEQSRRIRDVAGYMLRFIDNDPDYLALRAEMVRLDLTTEEGRKRSVEVQVEMQEMMRKTRTNLVLENLTPDHVQKLREFQISAMSEAAFVFPSMFEALDLSDEQRKQLDDIKKAMKPVFEKYIDKQVEYNDKHRQKLDDGLEEKLDAIPDQEGKQRLLDDIQRKIDDIQRKIRVELQPERNEITEVGKELGNTLKVRMFDVLTDEQWARMTDLIDNPPDYAKRAILQIRERQERDNASTGTWIPGPGAWQPGSGAIPEGYRIERNRKSGFPRGENPSP